jgi:hypothetical protein
VALASCESGVRGDQLAEGAPRHLLLRFRHRLFHFRILGGVLATRFGVGLEAAVAGDVAERDGKLMRSEKLVRRFGADIPWADALEAQCFASGFAQQTMLVQKLPNRVHPLFAAADHPAYAALFPAYFRLRPPLLVRLRRVEHAGPEGGDPAFRLVLAKLHHRPANARNSAVQT